MALDDYLEPEVAVAVAVTAVVASPPVRKAVRRGIVYGLAGLLTLGDKVAAGARSVAQSAKHLAEDVKSKGTEAEAASAAKPTVEVATS
jgi:hypothetical protein